ncbi:MAG TPA: ATP phosphoribosyltransferase regulatory subunit [Pseudomonadales bacterium]|nr:ATP phosphoribosyltransferase regulatory subunit [Pseudomonadales bacterium]
MSSRELDEGGRWLLPDGVEEILPPRAQRIEALRRRLLDEFDLWGYELVMPPLLEYLDSLLVGVGSDLDLQTLKITDQLTGRLMGLRADITSQAVRIDAHALRREGPTRLCYAGTVLRARPEGLFGSRAPIRIGAELYGLVGPAGDAEVLALMARTLAAAGVSPVHIELGHVAIYRALADAAGLAPDVERRLFDAVQRKARADIDALLEEAATAEELAEMIRQLPALIGGPEVMARARAVLQGAPAAVHAALDALEETVARVARRVPELELGFDLSELHGYNYHTGTVFSAYADDHGDAVARGGRYDDIGRAFGRARPATGFDADLKLLAELGTLAPEARRTLAMPADEDLDAAQAEALWRRVAVLRAAGVRVVPATDATATLEQLVFRDGDWQPQAAPADGER